jgi:hypothetical protein
VNQVQQAILQSARIEEMRSAIMEMATLCKRPTAVELGRTQRQHRRRLLALLAQERRRNARLVESISG